MPAKSSVKEVDAGEKYSITHEGGKWGWAHFTVNEKDGTLQIMSDYGNYAYCWYNHGCPTLKHFLTSLDKDYLLGKLGGARSVLDLDESLQLFKKQIQHDYKCGDLGKDAHNEMINDLENIKASGPAISADLFCQLILDCKVGEHYEYLGSVMTYPEDLLSFVRYIWPVFKRHLTKEVAIYDKMAAAEVALDEEKLWY